MLEENADIARQTIDDMKQRVAEKEQDIARLKSSVKDTVQ